MRTMIRVLAGAVLLTAALPVTAAAQAQMPAQSNERWFVSPFAGPSFGGDVTFGFWRLSAGLIVRF